MKALVWQWGRRGAGPRIALELTEGLRRVPGLEAALSLSTGAEILRGSPPPRCELPVRTYSGVAGFLARLAEAPLLVGPLARRVRALQADVAICAMPAPLDLLMLRALHRARVPAVVVVHDADPHPGDGLPFQMALQRRLTREADALVALTAHVAERLTEQGLVGRRPLLRASLPPLLFGPPAPPPGSRAGPMRLLSFGRLLPYKGLELLADALQLLGPVGIAVRVVGSGPESETLRRLRRMSGVTVENRWVPEEEVGSLLAWADALVLSHTEASQSGVAAAAIAARRWVVSTRVGGLAEQLADEPLARLCEPDPHSLVAALRGLIKEPPVDNVATADPHGAWRDVAQALVAQIERTLLGAADSSLKRAAAAVR